ncbi:MAG TPA: N-methyl-D-aspartate receptor NMDAR2C subunit [Aquabacterium sp.]|nr:N-methyl-D-aspartate receptor NMDAR2C subunit [Aquabacterium sp.]
MLSDQGMSQLAHSWARTWEHLNLAPNVGLFDALVAAYNEPHRRYHTIQHLQECLAHFSQVTQLALHPGEVEIALWFHDAIYELKGKDNERRSAEWALHALSQAGAQPEVHARVEGLIMATCHQAKPIDPDQQLLVDIDLAILGSPPARFAEYDRQVREEYSWVPGFLYRMKRKEVLKSFLARQAIYSTPHFSACFERQARDNLKSILA